MFVNSGPLSLRMINGITAASNIKAIITLAIITLAIITLVLILVIKILVIIIIDHATGVVM